MDDRKTAAAGWYPDPSGQPRRRYWDGQRWTDEYTDKELAVLRVPRAAIVIAVLVAVAGVFSAISPVVARDYMGVVGIAAIVVFLDSVILGVPWLLYRFDKWQKQSQLDKERNRALAINAEREHKAYLRGDDQLGVYGQFPPPPEVLDDTH